MAKQGIRRGEITQLIRSLVKMHGDRRKLSRKVNGGTLQQSQVYCEERMGELRKE